MLREKITISLSMIEIDQMKPKIENWRETIERILMIRKFKEKSERALLDHNWDFNENEKNETL